MSLSLQCCCNLCQCCAFPAVSVMKHTTANWSTHWKTTWGAERCLFPMNQQLLSETGFFCTSRWSREKPEFFSVCSSDSPPLIIAAYAPNSWDAQLQLPSFFPSFFFNKEKHEGISPLSRSSLPQVFWRMLLFPDSHRPACTFWFLTNKETFFLN